MPHSFQSNSYLTGATDADGDGKADLILRQDDGAVAIWTMNGLSVTGGGLVASLGNAWHLAGSEPMRFTDPYVLHMTATQSPDEFNFTNVIAGNHAVDGFNVSEDVLDLAAARFASFADVLAHTTSANGGSLIDLGNATTVFLSEIDPSSLQESNFALI